MGVRRYCSHLKTNLGIFPTPVNKTNPSTPLSVRAEPNTSDADESSSDNAKRVERCEDDP